jgi:hypothetical protein
LLALALLFVSVGHDCQHHRPQATDPGAHAFVIAMDDSGDGSSRMAITGEHCHVCTAATLPAAESVVVLRPDAIIPAARLAGVKAHIASHDTPPPRTTA